MKFFEPYRPILSFIIDIILLLKYTFAIFQNIVNFSHYEFFEWLNIEQIPSGLVRYFNFPFVTLDGNEIPIVLI